MQGLARDDDNFLGGSDRIRYSVSVDDSAQSVQITARLYYQSIGYRWAKNLSDYDSFETNRFVGYYQSNADTSHLLLADAQTTVTK